MCGISGIVGTRADEKLAVRMANAQRHRGPDSSGSYCEAGIALTHRRLKIIDLSSGADQPMCNDDKSVWLVYNGEIYNYVELKQELAEFRFKTTSDTEVLLRAYEKWGTECVQRFNGMFSFAIWDKKRGELFCARDRFGIKPFHYLQYDGGMMFSSELKPLLLSGIERKPDMGAIYDYLTRCVIEHDERTFFEGIKKLMPGRTLTYKDGKIKIDRYWNLLDHADEAKTFEGKEKEEFSRLLEDAIRIRFRSDVPVGICLSGGLDSGSIVSISNKKLGKQMHAFSAIFEGHDIDESKYMRMESEANKATLHTTSPTAKDLLKNLQDFMMTHEEPVTGPTVFAQWAVMKIAHDNGLKVLLDGQGADEMLAGYPIFYGARLMDLLMRLRLGEFAEELADVRRTTPYGGFGLIRTALFSYMPNSFRNGIIRDFSSDFLCPEFRKGRSINFPEEETGSYLKRYMYEKMLTGLPALLRYEDRNSMRFSIETRLPYLDYRLVSLGFFIPDELQVKGSVTKRILRESVRGMVPDEIIDKKRKIGFETPEADWLSTDLLPLAKEIIGSESFAKRNIFDVDKVKKLLGDIELKRTSDPSHVIWRCVNLELWMRMFIDSDSNKVVSVIEKGFGGAQENLMGFSTG